jgi:hypothetical protein
VLKKEQIE